MEKVLKTYNVFIKMYSVRIKNVVVPFDISVGEELITWHLQEMMD